MNRIQRSLSLLAVGGLAVAAGCADTDAVVLPAAQTPGGELFSQYVALGNSITAGTQSGGINDSTQIRAYPVLLAQQAGVMRNFGVPRLAGPDCSPLSAPFSTVRVPPRVNLGVGCARIAPVAERIHNLAVPGAILASAVNRDAVGSPLNTLILGGRSQADWMELLQPSLVSVWLGNNDALGAALTGNTAALTPVANFQTNLEALAARIRGTGAQDAVLIGVVDPGVVPALPPGVFAWLVKQNPQTAPLLPNPVSNNCAPVGPTGQPNPLAFNRVSLQIVGQRVAPNGPFLEISCADDALFVLTPAEQQQISERVAAFNNLIQQQAQANGWIYINPNAVLNPFLGDPSAIRRCQGLPAALATGNAQQIGQAVATTCPSPDPAQGFGNLFSFDAVHPSSRAHRIFANALITAINQKHNLSIATVTVN